MKRIFLPLLAIPAALCAQTTINGGRIIEGIFDASGSTRSLPNRTGTGSPAGRDACTSPGETYFQTDAAPGQNLWVCTAAGTPGTWNQITSGGGGATGNAASTVTTTFSSTPAFVCPSSTAGTVTYFALSTALTANITSSTLSGCTAGQALYFHFCQDSTGGRTVSMPSGFDPATLSPTATTCTDVSYDWDGSNGHLVANAGKDTPFIIEQASERAAPPTPPSNYAALWPDSTRHTWASTENNSANAHIMPRTSGASDQLASTDLSDSSGLARLGSNQTFSGNNTFSGTLTTNITGSTQCVQANSSGVLSGTGSACGSGSGGSAFSGITAGTNTSAAMTVGSGASLATSGTGTISATSVGGVTVSGTPSSGQVLTATSSTAAGWQTLSGGNMVYPGAGVANSTGSTWGTSYQVGTAASDLVQLNSSGQLPAVSGANVTNVQNVNSGSSAPTGNCTAGQIYFNTGATAGQNLYFCTATNAWTQMSAGGGSSTVTENIYVPFASQIGTGTSSCNAGPGIENGTGNNANTTPDCSFHGSGYGLPVYEFYNSGSFDYIYYTTMLHQSWVSGTSFNIVLQGLQGSTSGNAYFTVATACSTTTALSGLTFNTAAPVTLAGGSSFKPVQGTISGISMSGCAAGDVIVFQIGRDSGNSNDTMSGAIYLLGMQLQYQHT